MSVTISRRAQLPAIPQPAIEIESAPPVERVETTPRVPRPGLGAVWGDALSTFSAQAAPILFLALIGFAGAVILCTALSAAFGLQFYVYASGPFATHTGLAGMRIERFGIFDGHVANTHALLLVQAVIGLFGLSFARGAITYIVLQANDQRCEQCRTACRAALVRFPALLMSSLVYGGLIACAAVGVNVLLRELHFDLNNAGQTADTFEGAWRVIAMRAVNALIPDSGSPFAEFVPYWRSIVFMSALDPRAYETQIPDSSAYSMTGVSSSGLFGGLVSHSSESWLIAFGCIALIFLAETLLRFRTVMAFRFSEPNPLAPLINSLRFGFKHFGLIVVHVGLLRLAVMSITVSCVILPMVLVEGLAMPHLMPLIQAPIAHFSRAPLILVSITLVNAILMAFSVVYDARLAMRLEASHSTNLNEY